MNKSLIVHYLPLNLDAINYICSFIFYTLEQSITRHKKNYNKVVCDLFYTVRLNNLNQNVTLIIYNLQSNFDIQFVICCKCGNYANVNCKCNLLK